jgi:hypothetical protein
VTRAYVPLRPPHPIAAFLLLALGACGGDGGPEPTSPDPVDQVSAVISGPDQVVLNCQIEAEATFSSSESTGFVSVWSWNVDGEEVGNGGTLTHTFREHRSHVLRLRALNMAGEVLASTQKTISTALPADLAPCLATSKIVGRGAVLIRPGDASIEARYELSAAEPIRSQITSYEWHLKAPGSEPQVVASGADASAVDVSFEVPGEHVLSVEPFIGGDSRVVEMPVPVFQGEPLLEPGTIAFLRGIPPEHPAIHLMDAETGYVSEPVFQHSGLGSVGACREGEIIVPINETTASGNQKPNIFTMRLDGSGLERIIASEGNVWMPSVGPQGRLAVVDDVRWNFARDELAIYDPGASTPYRYLSGASTDVEFVGFRSSWSPNGTQIAMGDVELSSIDGERVVIYHVASGTRRPLHENALEDVYGPNVMMEGVGGVAWDPLDEYIAVSVNYTDERFLIALVTVDGNSIGFLTEGNDLGQFFWTPSGSHLLFTRIDYDLQSTEMMAVPREGGEPINLTRARGESRQVWDASFGYCHGG